MKKLKSIFDIRIFFCTILIISTIILKFAESGHKNICIAAWIITWIIATIIIYFILYIIASILCGLNYLLSKIFKNKNQIVETKVTDELFSMSAKVSTVILFIVMLLFPNLTQTMNKSSMIWIFVAFVWSLIIFIIYWTLYFIKRKFKNFKTCEKG